MHSQYLKATKAKWILLMVLLAVFWTAYGSPITAAEKNDQRKAVIFVIDRIGIDDLVKADMPNFKSLLDKSGIGLMNVRGKSFSWENRESGYLSLNMGMRASYPQDSGKAGNFGRTARENGLKIAVLEKTNSSRPDRQTILLAADENGKVPYTVTGSNNELLLAEFARIYEIADILVINYGESSDVLNQADNLLGRIFTKIDQDNTLLLLLTPNPSQEMISQGNFSLTPVIMTGPRIKGGIVKGGIVTSGTTKRPGLVANVDFVPTVFKHFGINKNTTYIGEPIRVSSHDNALTYTINSLAQYKNLKISRYIMHGFYVAVTVLAMVFLYMPVLRRRLRVAPAIIRFLACGVITLPMVTFMLSPFLNFAGSYLFTLIIVFTTSILSCLLSRAKKLLPLLGGAGFITAIVLLAGLFTGGGLYLNSPLGFSDVFMGGRYYGMNNDTMGILLGATVLGQFLIFHTLRFSRGLAIVTGLIFTLLPVVGLSPRFGANVGGTIAAMVVATVTVTVLAGKKPVHWRQVMLIVIAVFAVEIGIAYLDATLNPERTHAGKVLTELLSGDFGAKFLKILWSKLSLFLLMLIIPPWNLILLAEFYLIYKMFRQGEFSRMQATHPYLAKGFTVLFFGGVVAFLFNDTGVIATAMMFTYLIIPLGLLLSIQNEYI